MLPLSGHLERAGLGCDSKRADYREKLEQREPVMLNHGVEVGKAEEERKEGVVVVFSCMPSDPKTQPFHNIQTASRTQQQQQQQQQQQHTALCPRASLPDVDHN
ncbi:hypothetical protein F7725_022836 [Dissostichus mawsoni]|uniref:Uncharacterized protein n=1 Tax=Dissostichus mawsoni TaxID=36200 RepID=A0A7J5Z0Z5_DISMA|nr:hypothetical protein F7725_022836 [Dissostichus mawsoni]